jgi:hypothetical protein
VISATLGLDISPFLERLNQVREKIEGLSRMATIFTAGNLIGKEAFEGLSEGIEKIRGIVEMGGQLQDLSLNTGQSVHDLVILRQAFQNAGLGADAVGPMLAKFQKALSGVNEEGQPTNHALERLKLNVDGFREMPAIEQFRTLQRSLEGIHDPVERTQIAMELFGKTGAKMLAFLAEGEGLDQAEDQVGGLANTMERSAEVFHQVGNAITTLGQKAREVFAGIFAEILPGINGGLQSLTRIDLTGIGEQIGQMLNKIGALVAELWKLKPVLEAIAIQFAFGLTGEKVFASIEGMIQSLRGLQVTIGAQGGAIAAFRTMLSTPLASGGLIAGLRTLLATAGKLVPILGAITSIMWAFGEWRKSQEAGNFTGLGTLDNDLHRGRNENVAEYAHVTDDEGKEELAKKLREQLDQLHEKIVSVEKDYAYLGGHNSHAANIQRAEITKRLEQEAAFTERLIQKTDGLTDAQMKAHDAMRIAADAAKEYKKALDDLYAAQAKLKGDLEKEDFDKLNPEQQEKTLLRQAYVGAPFQVDEKIEDYDRKTKSGNITPAEIQEAQRLIGIREQLIQVEKRIAEEKDKQAKKDQETAKKAEEELGKRNDFVRKETLEIAKLRAEAKGDHLEEDRIDRQQRYDRYFTEGKDNHLLDGDAARFAANKVDLEDQAKAEKEKEKQKVTVSSDADRRVGLGGRAYADHSNPLLEAHRQSTKATTALKGSIDKLTKQLESKPERVVMPSKAVFG